MARWRAPHDVRVAHRLEVLGIRIGVATMKRLPHRTALAFGAALGSAAFRLGVRREVAIDNIRRAADVVSPDEAPRVAHDAYRNLGRTFAEYARLPVTSLESLRARVRFEGLEHMQAALARGRGVVAVSGHFGSLELMATAFRLLDAKPTLLVAPMRNPLATQYFRRHRSAYGVDVAEVGPRLREAFRVLRRGGLLCIAADQDAGRHGMFVDFLGRPASTATGAVELAMRTGAPIVFGLTFREGVDHHRLVIEPPMDVTEGEDRERTIRTHLERLSRLLEAGIRARPDHWFWLHRRWKTQPADVSHPLA